MALHLCMYVVHSAKIVDGHVHCINDCFDKSGTESGFGCRIDGNVLGPVSEGVFDVRVTRFCQKKTAFPLRIRRRVCEETRANTTGKHFAGGGAALDTCKRRGVLQQMPDEVECGRIDRP